MKKNIKSPTSSFTINTSILLKEIKNLSKVLGGMSEQNIHTISELTITDGQLEVVIPGAKLFFDCETKNSAKVAIKLFHFLDILKTHKELMVTCVITENTMAVNGVLITVKTTFFKNDSILRSIHLPLNFTDFDVLRLERDLFYTEEEIDFNNLNINIYLAKQTLNSNVKIATNALKIYGVDENDIVGIINKKIDLDLKKKQLLRGS